VYITDQNHSYDDPDLPIGRQWPVNSAVSIGAGSWLGTGAIILPGTTIGRNVVVAAGAVVRGKVPDRCMVAGVPARVIREHVEGIGWQPPPPPEPPPPLPVIPEPEFMIPEDPGPAPDAAGASPL